MGKGDKSDHEYNSCYGKKPSLALSYSVPDNVKKLVISGHFVSLYKLLLGYSANAATNITSFTEDDGTIKLRLGDFSKDRKLTEQTLIFPKLILALLKFKDILSSSSSRNTEFIDRYLSNLTLISNKYSGTAYWTYHLHFWGKAAEFEDKGLTLD